MTSKVKLDSTICNSFRDAVNDSPTISNEQELSSLHNLSCAVMDRLDSAVEYLNNHWDFPNTEEDFICFMVFACIINDGVNKIYRRTIGTFPKCNEKKYFFKDYCMGRPLYLSEDDCPTDEEFFEYIRSLSFAHPYETNRNKTFCRIFGTQVSPWVVVNKHTLHFYHYSEPIGVRLYSTIPKDEEENDIYDIMFSFEALRGYLVAKYSALNDVTQWIVQKSEDIFSVWKTVKVNRKLSCTDILRDICRILDMRHESTYEIEIMIRYLEIPISDNRNLEVVNQYREYLKGIIPDLCNYVDSLNSSGLYEQERKVTSFNPLGLHQMAYYQLEKIFLYLNEKHSYVPLGSNEEWGLIQAESFYNEFAKKWVVMDVYNMDYDEIKLLITVSLFMEYMEQQKAV